MSPASRDDREDAVTGPVLVLGAGSGLARAFLARLAREGTPALGVCHSEGGLAAARAAGLDCAALGSPEELPALCERRLGALPAAYVDAMHSRVECLVAQAAPGAVEEWAREDIALRARCLAAVSRAMLARRRGRCLFISSSAAARPAPGQGLYAAAKLAGESLFTSVGLELASRGVTACSLRLGWLDSGRGHRFLAGREDAAARLVPTRRLVDVDEAVGAMRYLLTSGARAFNATIITLDGGFSAVKPSP